MEKGNRFIFRFVLVFLFSFILVLTSSCKSSTQTEPLDIGQTGVNTGGASLVSNALPAWEAGEFGSVQLTATSGTAPYTWSLKKGSEMPQGFTLNSDGVISGTASLLPSGTSKSISPPFVVVVTDSNGQKKEFQLSITILQPEIDLNNEATEDAEQFNNQASEPASSIDNIITNLTRTEGGEYYFDIEANGTVTAPVGYSFSIKLDGHSPDEQTSSWTQEGTIEFARLVFRRDAEQPEFTTWRATWHNYMINQGQFDLQLNKATVQLELSDDENLYIDSQEESLQIPHP